VKARADSLVFVVEAVVCLLSTALELYDVCLEVVKSEDYQNCSVCCVVLCSSVVYTRELLLNLCVSF